MASSKYADQQCHSDAIELVLRLLIKLDHEHNVDDVLVDQSKAFLVAVLSMYVAPCLASSSLTSLG